MPSWTPGPSIEPDGTPHVPLYNDPLTQTCVRHEMHHMLETVMMRRRGGGKGHLCGTRPGGGGAWGERSGLVYAASVVGVVSGDAECEGLWLLADVLSFQ